MQKPSRPARPTPGLHTTRAQTAENINKIWATRIQPNCFPCRIVDPASVMPWSSGRVGQEVEEWERMGCVVEEWVGCVAEVWEREGCVR